MRRIEIRFERVTRAPRGLALSLNKRRKSRITQTALRTSYPISIIARQTVPIAQQLRVIRKTRPTWLVQFETQQNHEKNNKKKLDDLHRVTG